MKRKVVTLCGSTRFRKEFRKVERALTLSGEIPLPPAIYGKAEGIEYSEELSQKLWEIHLDKIRISDEIFVINPEGYLGDSTKKEIEFAKSLGKVVRYYSKESVKIEKILKKSLLKNNSHNFIFPAPLLFLLF